MPVQAKTSSTKMHPSLTSLHCQFSLLLEMEVVLKACSHFVIKQQRLKTVNACILISTIFFLEPLLATWHSTTPPVKSLSHDRLYYFLPYWDDKPTMYIRSTFPDHRKRMYNSNAIGRIADKVVII